MHSAGVTLLGDGVGLMLGVVVGDAAVVGVTDSLSDGEGVVLDEVGTPLDGAVTGALELPLQPAATTAASRAQTGATVRTRRA